MIEIKSAKYIDDFKIWIKFNDGTEGIVDLKNDLWGRIFEPLQDIELFKKFQVSEIMNTIAWDNGADLAPEFLYEKVNGVTN